MTLKAVPALPWVAVMCISTGRPAVELHGLMSFVDVHIIDMLLLIWFIAMAGQTARC
jgi:hypothetical protein